VWSPVSHAQIEKLEKVQRRFTKRLFGLSKMTYVSRLQQNPQRLGIVSEQYVSVSAQ